MTTKFNRILFDYDGTLIIHDKENEGEQIAEKLNIDKNKIQLFSERLKKYFETSYGRMYYRNKKITRELYYVIMDMFMVPGEFGITVKQLDRAINEKSKYDAKIEPTAKETLEYLISKGYQLCIFTNGFLDAQVDNMRHNGFYEYFDRIYAWDDFYAKPDERAVIRALGRTDPKNNIMVGDSLINDIIPAKKQGIYTVGISLSDHNETDVLPDKQITTLSELKTFL